MTTIAKPRIRVPAVTERWALPAPAPSRARPTSAYMRGEWSPFFKTWRPALREASIDVAQAYSAAAARAVDTVQNSGWIAGAVDQIIAREIGTGLRLSSRPDTDVLKWTTDETQNWARKVERRWEGYANRPIDCDLSGRSTVAKLAAQALRSQFCFGEIVATLPFLKRPDGGQYGTKVNVISPHRLLHHYEMPNIFDGVRREPDTGYPLAYRIGTPLDFSAGPYKWRDIPARDGFGRPQCIHVFDGFAGQVRGIPPITPVLRVVRQFDQLADATLMQALIQAIFAATVTSPAPTEQVLQAFQDMAEQTPDGGLQSPMEALMNVQADWYEKTDIDIGQHGKIAHLAPGDTLEFHGSKTPHEFYEPFTRFLLREIARALGITFEEMTGDYSGATYSSVRMATSVTWAIVLYRRANISSPFYQPIFECWLEEEIENGWIDFPGGVEGFIANRAAATRTHWSGPAKPQADDLKFAKAIDTLYRLGVVSHEWIAGELGLDPEDTYEQLAREKAMREKLGLPDPLLVVPPTPQNLADEEAGETPTVTNAT
jgi:lambda family phage portal protein